LALTCFVTCFFLVLNSAVVSIFYPPLAAAGPGLLRHPRVAQMIMYLAPVVLIFIEWWIVDLAVELVTPARHGVDDQETSTKRR
jgi:hypothetical protein